MLQRVWIPSPNYSDRAGAGVRLIVVHTAEGARTIESLGAFFANPDSGVSSHVGIDDKPGTAGEYVTRDAKAWTQGQANPVAVAAELCAFAAWDPAEWDRHPAMLDNCAAWIAEEAAIFGLPIVRLDPASAQGGGRGVCAHSDLGAWGGNHSDPGAGFPWSQVIAKANQLAGAPTPTPPPGKGRNMIASTSTGEGYWTVTHDGAVNAFGDAEYKGGAYDPDILTGEVVGIAGRGVDGYWLYASDGGVFAFGSAEMKGRPDRF
jgi:hypothetical protein